MEAEGRYSFLECVDCGIFLPQSSIGHRRHKLHAVDFEKYMWEKYSVEKKWSISEMRAMMQGNIEHDYIEVKDFIDYLEKKGVKQ